MIPAHITEARNALGLNKVALAKLVGVSEAALRGWESGQKPMPRTAFLLLRAIFWFKQVRVSLWDKKWGACPSVCWNENWEN